MYIEKIEIENFRQFYGKQSITFSQKEDNNVTVIMGANGNGKTGIFRALIFGLFGDIKLEQDNKTKDTINLVNLNLLKESEGSPVRACVTLDFTHNNEKYHLVRTYSSLLRNGKIVNHPGMAELSLIDSRGDSKVIQPDQIQVYINKIIDRDIREFFFFDAEKMELLAHTKNNNEISKEIRNGIVKLLQIKNLEDLTKNLGSKISEEEREFSRKAKDSDMETISKKKDSLINIISESDESIKKIAEEKKLAIEEKNKIESKLAENKDIRILQDKRDSIDEKIEIQKALIQSQKERLKAQLKNQPYLYLSDDIFKNQEVLLEELKKSQKDIVPIEIIEQSIEKEQCYLCQNNLHDHPENMYFIKQLKEQFKFSELTSFINQIQQTARETKNKKDDYSNNLKNIIKDIEDAKRKRSEFFREKDSIDEQIGDKANNIENLIFLEKQLGPLQDKINKLKENSIRVEYAMDEKNKEIEELDRQLNRLRAKHGDLELDNQIINKMKILKEYLENTFGEYSDSTRQQLASEITSIFKELIDDKDRNLIYETKIDERFQISVVDIDGINKLQDISQGQGQIFSLAFITALAKIASKGRSEINFPLFMDTPFGRISGNNRDNLIRKIPLLTSQWILLLTDTEFTNAEKDVFIKENRVGAVYELVNLNGKTEIKEHSSLEALKLRG